jgi:hypothetical protein
MINMKRIQTIFITFLAVTMFMLSCQIDDALELGTPMTASEINMEVKQEFSIDPGGNTVVFRNHTMGIEPVWDYGTGRSIRQVDTVRYAFKGTYTIKRFALTRNGIVELSDVSVEVTEDNLNYVNDPLWNLVSGGVGNEKTWVLDLDASARSKYFAGPIFFSGVDWGYGNVCTKEDGSCWTWFPAYQSWMPAPGDYGTMTFNLKGGPFITVDQKIISGGNQSGSYYLDKDARTITFTDVVPLNMGWPQIYSKAYIISLTEDAMQLAFRHPDKAEFEIYNYITKEYSDNWVPPAPSEPTPDEGFDPAFAPGELLDMLTGGAGAGRQWKLDADGNPVDWVAKGNGWTTDKNSSWNWGWNESWVTASTDAWIMFDRFNGGQNYTRFQKGTTTTGTFSINEATNEITLTSNTLLQNPDSWMNPATNTIKVVKAFPEGYQSKGIWFGTGYDAEKDEWLVFHYILR